MSNELLTIIICFMFQIASLVLMYVVLKSYALQLKRIRRDVAGQKLIISALNLSVDKLSKSLADFIEHNQKVKEFITEADANLKTIINEYEVNGVPLGYDRRGARAETPRVDFYEGL